MDTCAREEIIQALCGEGFIDDEVNMSCPTCDHEYSRVREAYTRMGCDPAEAHAYPGAPIKAYSGERRSALVVIIEGECGHTWNLVIQQRKGINSIQIEK